MKKLQIVLLVSLLIPLIVFMLYKPNNVLANTSSQKKSNVNGYIDTINADINLSELLWKGFKLTGQHNGNLKLSKGTFYLNKKSIVGGEFTFDMNTINCLDLNGKWKDKLEMHLKDIDFFDVDSYPNANFIITSVNPINKNDSLSEFNVSGNLRLKDSILNIQFPANLLISDSIIKATSKPFNIDRTKWGIMYKSKKILDNWKEGYLYDEIEIIINVVGKR